MNYQKIYNHLIEKRKNNRLSKEDCYCERHHIIPTSEGGNDNDENLIYLTAREHYIAHLLLAKIYDDLKMYCAITYMQTGRHRGRKFKYNNRLYGKVREEFGKKISKLNKGRKHTEETRRKLSLSRTGEKHFMYGKHHSEETKRKISLAHKGKGLGNKHAVGSKGHTGLKWITDGIIEKTLPIGETPPPGFRFGRCYTKCKKENA